MYAFKNFYKYKQKQIHKNIIHNILHHICEACTLVWQREVVQEVQDGGVDGAPPHRVGAPREVGEVLQHGRQVRVVDTLLQVGQHRLVLKEENMQ